MALTALSIASARIAKFRVGWTVLGAAPFTGGVAVISSNIAFHSMAALFCGGGGVFKSGTTAGAALPEPDVRENTGPDDCHGCSGKGSDGSFAHGCIFLSGMEDRTSAGRRTPVWDRTQQARTGFLSCLLIRPGVTPRI